MEVLAIVPARGGSKGIPRKNLVSLLGHPLLWWSVKAALDSETVTRTIVSTDDAEIAAIAAAAGAEVPFMRPDELAGDTVVDLPVFAGAGGTCAKNARATGNTAFAAIGGAGVGFGRA